MTNSTLTSETTALLRRAIGKRIAHLMEHRMITRPEMADAIGVTDMRMARIMKGSSDMTVPQLIWCAKVLNCSLETLTGR